MRTDSVEFMNAHPTPQTFIQGLYLDILGRLPGTGSNGSTNELGFWETQLGLVGAVAVTGSILTSTESYTDIIDNYYLMYLDRAVDANGLDNWLTQLQTGQGTVESVAEGIL